MKKCWAGEMTTIAASIGFSHQYCEDCLLKEQANQTLPDHGLFNQPHLAIPLLQSRAVVAFSGSVE
jgi:hypothetical protein